MRRLTAALPTLAAIVTAWMLVTVPVPPLRAEPALQQWSSPPPFTIDPSKQYTATIRTSLGTMTVELFANDAPNTVNNFVFLARERFYDSVPFHRIISGFMVQTGDPTGTGRGGPGYRFEDELSGPHG